MNSNRNNNQTITPTRLLNWPTVPRVTWSRDTLPVGERRSVTLPLSNKHHRFLPSIITGTYAVFAEDTDLFFAVEFFWIVSVPGIVE